MAARKLWEDVPFGCTELVANRPRSSRWVVHLDLFLRLDAVLLHRYQADQVDAKGTTTRSCSPALRPPCASAHLLALRRGPFRRGG